MCLLGGIKDDETWCTDICLPFQTAVHGIKFCTSLDFNICCYSDAMFFTDLTDPKLCIFASDSLTFLLS